MSFHTFDRIDWRNIHEQGTLTDAELGELFIRTVNACIAVRVDPNRLAAVTSGRDLMEKLWTGRFTMHAFRAEVEYMRIHNPWLLITRRDEAIWSRHTHHVRRTGFKREVSHG